MDKETVEQLVAAQLAAGLLGIVLDPNDDVDEMASTSVLIYQLVLFNVRKHGTAWKPVEPGTVTSFIKKKRGID